MDVLICTDPDEVAVRAADRVLQPGSGTPTRIGVLGLATGSSPLGLYRELGRAADEGRADFSRTQGFALDEYVGLPPGDPRGYRATLLREVCDVLHLPPTGLHVPDGSGADLAALEAAARNYEEAIAAAGGVDVQILGIGSNGHLGFNEPGSALSSRTRVKRLSERTRVDNARFFTALSDVPTHCLTQGLGTILAARRLVLVAAGAAKAEAVAAALEGPLTASVPGSILQWHADAVVVLDEAAAGKLANRAYYDEAAAGLPGHARSVVDTD